ncbi:MAG: hypothetical protein MUF62_05905 [Chitinophagaceae bacterium]|nr:hypothetical protein [Chitinophagaceae bacterium]
MKNWWLIGACLLSALAGKGQAKEVLLKQQTLVIRYLPDSTETSQAVYSRFGNTDSLFLALNKPDSLRPDPYLYLAISSQLQPQCPDNACVFLYYQTQAGDDFGKLARLFGYADPFELKAMNAGLESLPAGTVLHVGHLPVRLFSSGHFKGAMAVPAEPAATSSQPLYRGAGAYQPEYKNLKTVTQVAKTGVFKSLGGWYDGKFYLLAADVPAGTVLRVSNPANGVSVFAKVVGPLPTIKGEKPLQARLNSAARAALGIWDEQDHELVYED